MDNYGETMNEKTFQALVRYGSIVIAACVILNVYLVMRHVEIYREAVKMDAGFQQLVLKQQALQNVLQEFAARASTDPEIAAVFKKAQAMSGPTGSASAITNQPLPPTASGAGR